MKYYSEKLRKTYDTEKACIEAETAYEEKIKKEKEEQEKLASTRKERANEVEEAYKAALDAQKKYTELRNKFVADYGTWHMTISSQNDGDWINYLFRLF